MGNDEDTKAVTKFVIENSEVPMVIDADGINCLKDNIDIIDNENPKKLEPVSPTKVFAGLKLNVKNASIEPARINAIKAVIG